MTVSGLRALHHDRAPGDPLVLPGPWDAASARVLAEAGFPALAVPSAGVAASLGYEDGATPADEMFAAVARIARAVSVPVSADIEAGYGLAAGELVERILDAGAVGCNLEDTVDGVLVDAGRQADRLAAVRAAAGDALFVNARIDTYVTGVPDSADPVAETLRRARLYAAAGADCLYPIAAPVEVFGPLAGALPGLPLNALAVPDGPGPGRLGELGATRITFGPGLQRRAMAALRGIADDLR
ncbi:MULTISPECIES: isocitrate lyase/phosphoenolpyruvate mutase family protein [unclassified Streptomyces]|uniref:isocitrate lyase/PEP mutase family protein n=1 Tax=unclassified Streptomyces TaxID=2593676 RepID=UPI002ED0F462|nr:isocitrate lyase/phosphoenolpyruvate mutase family protein [Streptomyces sp. NBC_00891]WSY07322.1 isocitrate lyase/phosphoenolpyruvate mutase family protein [Streptomyces sp. NBC_00890]WSZ08948.1 isocitrate lyase/phosphoenolpyruvate mutase family protein [Streptomyces sp. NBC_00869]WSZ23554.1 isocitrate lyase/phosphoenolpyruvate mutase family protein [Streptomyces sp. NBC_00870]